MKNLLLIFACLILFAAPLFSQVKEAKTGVPFPETTTIGDRQFDLAGVGLRTKFVVKVYAGALYLDASARQGLAQWKGKAASPDQSLYDAIIQGGFAKLFVMHFVRDVGGDKITEAFQEGIEKSVNLKAPDIAGDLASFLKGSKIDMKNGQELKILVAGDEITTIPPGGQQTVVKNAKLARAVTGIWLGKQPISEDLKKGMVSRLPSLL